VAVSHFRRCLEIGRGRAALEIQSGSPALFREDLRYACTNNTIFDPAEGERAPYLLQLIEMTGEPKWYRDGILAALAAPGENRGECDLGQMFDLALIFARRGDTHAKQSMLAAFECNGFIQAGLSCAKAIISLNGLDAFLLATEKLSQNEPDHEEQLWQFGAMLRELQELDGEESTNQALGKIASDSPDGNLARLLEADRVERAQRTCKVDTPRRNYAAIKTEMAEEGGRLYCSIWGKAATQDELAEAADDLLVESDETRLWSYLSIFRDRRFPRAHDRLLSLAHHENARVATSAVNALAHITSSDIRALAMDLTQDAKRYGDAVELLRNNSQQGDYLILERLLTEQMDDEGLHALGMGVRHYVQAHLKEEAVRSLILFYEKGPCGMCRHACVEHLIALDKLPEWMCNECRYDSYSATRELVNT
jgi:hypothetical protein